MKKYFIFLLVLLTVVTTSKAQKSRYNQGLKVPPPVCYASGKVEKSFVPPPDEFLLKSGAEAKSDIIITYSLFPQNARVAFEYAVSIWESIIESDMPIRMKADWRTMNNNVLGSCGPETYYSDFKDAPAEDRYYPVAIAEKISKTELNGTSRMDIEATFNKNIDWYFGTDGNTPDSLYDFVTVVLHEIGHGLGFTGFFFIDDNLGAYGFFEMGNATSFDMLVEKNIGKRLVDTSFYQNTSVELKQALESSVLYAHSPVAMTNNNGQRPRLYAPIKFDDGSSIYHLNDATYPHGNENSLMTHAIGKGEAIHDPGPLTRGIMEDIGWKNLIVQFTQPKDIEEIKPINFEVLIKSDYELDTSSLYLIYSDDAFEVQADTLLLAVSDKPNSFTAQLIPEAGTENIHYYVEVTDSMNRVKRLPNYAPRDLYSIRIGPDNEKPVISHSPIPYFLLIGEPLLISVNADDNLGIDTVYVEYSINDVAQQPFGLKYDSVTIYSGIFDTDIGNLHDRDEISYRIVAKDSSAAQNIAQFPADSIFSFRIEEIYEPVISYVNDFDQPTSDFIISDFDIYTEDDFENGALHSPHPYPSPDEDNKEFNFSTLLKRPVIITESGYLTFDEVVLVEPGEPLSYFGSEDFWDYVILEGSKDFGKTWKKLFNGYDSGDNDVWHQNYNANIVDQISQATGNSEWFVNRTIYFNHAQNFNTGDTILIQFRLYSDPYAHGWGWAIDNLRIQQPVSAKISKLSPGNVLVYPNPFNDIIQIRFFVKQPVSEIRVDIFNMFGQKLHTLQKQNVVGKITEEIDLGRFGTGMYMVRVSENGQLVLSKKLIKY
ncbi:MAG: T9SS type A sorting domain-containing protein [Bacteroidota bacterium]